MTIAAYIRVSTKAQDHKTQRHAIEAFARSRGDVIDEWFAEKVSASKTMDRPELNRLRAEGRRFQRVYVFKLDRLARTGIRDTFAVLEGLRDVGCKVVTVADGLDLDGPMSDIIIAVLAFCAKLENVTRNDRIAAARMRMADEGTAWGRPIAMGELDRQRALQLRQEGKSVRYIAQALGFKKSVVGRAVRV